MIIDAHVHVFGSEVERAALEDRLSKAGIDGAALLSEPPEGFFGGTQTTQWQERLDRVMEWCAGTDALYPLYWIDPTHRDALSQVERADAAGVRGFKIIADHFYPGTPQAMETYHGVAETGKPILFHSGILWDDKVSSTYNRPVHFEPLITVPGLRFALAHVSWPWHDECLAVYGKFSVARQRQGSSVPEMYIDLTPGTPAIYRREVLTKLCTIDYDILDNLLFGTDAVAYEYDTDWARSWIERDRAIFSELDVTPEKQEAIFSGNLLRFLSIE